MKEKLSIVFFIMAIDGNFPSTKLGTSFLVKSYCLESFLPAFCSKIGAIKQNRETEGKLLFLMKLWKNHCQI